ncbi:MAG: methyltransferase [bacterium]
MNGDELKKEFGDYQTPEEFATSVCEYLQKELRICPNYIIEPTSGIGNFLRASANLFPSAKKIYGIEINEEYCSHSRQICDKRIEVICDNYFTFDSTKLVDGKSSVLVIGNPPWATNSELNFNLPEKVNFKGLSGTDAITGASNFDICEYIVLKIIEEFDNTSTTVAMLCKTSVARNVYMELNRSNRSFEYVKMLNFNSSKVFGISAAACLLVIKLSEESKQSSLCTVYDFEKPDEVIHSIAYKDGTLSIQDDTVLNLDGTCQLEWRQGVKHDCASVMELRNRNGSSFENKKKEVIELEDVLVFPLMKSSSFKKPIIADEFDKFVIVTQKKARDDTSYIQEIAPKTWTYLNQNKELFDKRKSSIYKGAPDFSMFGVGDYSYAPYKVGISGFYKKPLFSLLFNRQNVEHPIMLDDTSYFLSFNDYDMAYVCMLLFNSEKVQNFLFSISFQDAKRPYTKKVLQRLDIQKCIENVSLADLKETEMNFGLPKYISDKMYENFSENFMK